MDQSGVSLYVFTHGSQEAAVMTSLFDVDPAVKKIQFDKVQEIAMAFGISDKLIEITEGRAKVRACYYRQPMSSPDELVVVIQ